MALLQQLLIQGIRSVGPDATDAHCIKFLSPLTLIAGPNGTGKTTIIEALNFITAGDTPKSSDGKYNSLIHSIQIARRARVDGIVKLEFTDIKKQKIVASKRIWAQKDAKTKCGMKCGADESNIQITRRDGSVVSNSNKVMDTRQEVLNLLGVPKAILSNVTFCHQEESCWPLSEPKELKKRFDNIFQLTRFVKAVEQMKKVKKEHETELKRIVAEQKSAEMLIKQKAKHMKDRDASEKLKKEGSDRLADLKQDIERLNKEIKERWEQLQQMEKVQRAVDVKRAELGVQERSLMNVRVTAFFGSEEELRLEIQQLSSSDEYRDLEDQRRQIEDSIADEQLLMTRNRDQKKRLEANLVQFMTTENSRKETAFELDQLKGRFCEEYHYSPVCNFPVEMNTLLEEKVEALEDAKKAADGERATLQSNLEGAQQALTQNQVETRNLEQMVRKIDGEIRDIETRLRNAAGSETKIAALNDRITVLEASLSDLPAVDESRVSEIQGCRQALRIEVDRLRRECREAEEFDELLKAKDRKTEDRSEAQKKLNNMLEKHKEDFEDIFGEGDIRGPWSQKVAASKSKIEGKLKASEDAVSRANIGLERERHMLKQLEGEERKAAGEIEGLKRKIEETCGCASTDVEKQLKEVRKDLKTARKELGPLSSKAELYESWTEEVKSNSCCPLCDRRFTSKGGATNLVEKLQNMTLSLPEEVDRLQMSVTELEQRERKMADAMVYVEQIEKLDAHLRETSGKKSNCEEKLSLAESHADRCKGDQLAAKEAYQRVSRVWADISLMDSHLKSINLLDQEIVSLQRRLPEGSHLQSFATLRQNLDGKEEELNRLDGEGDQLQRAASKRSKIMDELMKMRESRVVLGETAAQGAHLQEQLKSKKSELQELTEGRRTASARIPDLERNVRERRDERDRFETRWRQEYETMNAGIREIRSLLQKFEHLNSKLNQLSNSTDKIEKCQKDIEECNTLISSAEGRCGRLEAQFGDIEGCKARKRTLDDQLDRMLLEKRVMKLREELEELSPMSDEDVAKMKAEMQEMQKRRERDERERSKITGQMEEVTKKFNEAVSALSKKEMKNAEKAFRDILVDKIVCEKTAEDLGKYGELLDASILQFHSEKMTAINEILDDLWRKVYKGVDIESIKIRADAASSTDKRKSYDYKVVMIVEGGIEVEMRDRCSAGQKMLASILIRIALADVFGGMCSIIALDEPTTNLDAAKVEHMAEMLNDLIAARRTDKDGVTRGRQFQMIVITHDERLVDRLTLGCRPEFHYVLGKNEKGLSYIKRQYPNGNVEDSVR